MQKNFKIYTASAGAGKTYALVKEYLIKCFLSNEKFPFSKILAITFTNKASAEMKARVLQKLRLFSRGKDEDFLKEISDETKISKKILQKKSRTLLFSILHNYSNFWIGTIDKFTYQVARSFSKELGISLNAELELDQEKTTDKSIDILLSKVGLDKDLTNSLVKYIQHKTDDGKSWQIELEIKNIAKNINKEHSNLFLEDLRKLNFQQFQDIKKSLASIIELFNNEVTRYAKNANENLISLAINPDSFSRSCLPNYYKKIIESNLLVKNDFEIKKTLNQRLKKEKPFYPKKISDNQKKIINDNEEKIFNDFNLLQEYIERNKSLYFLAILINKNIYSLAILKKLVLEKKRYKNNNNIVELSEFNRKINRIVKHEPIPFLYEKIGERFNHFLIDEFQDTSKLQWENLTPLILNSIANTNESCSVFGDGKQSIYRWRNSNVNQFLHLASSEKRTIEENSKGTINKQIINLKFNWRSDYNIVTFNNNLFKTCVNLAQGPIAKRLYKKSFQEIPPTRKKTKGWVRVEYLKKDNWIEENLYKTLKTVKDLKKDYQLKDIAIIVRKNTHANLIAKHLSYNNIDVISPESLLLINNKKVNVIIDALRLSINQDNQISKNNILSYFTIYYNLNLTKESLAPIEQSLKKQKIDLNFEQISKLPVFESVNKIITAFKWSDSDDSYLQSLCETIHLFQTKNSVSIVDFLSWWDENYLKQTIKIPEEINAIKILTIHKAKGLEFPIVIFPFANWEINKEPNSPKNWISLNDEFPPLPTALINMEKTVEETNYKSIFSEYKNNVELDNLNLLYVTLTRAINALYVFTSNKNENNLNKYFNHYLSTINAFNKDETSYSLGKKSAINASSDKENIENITHFTSTMWWKSLKIACSFENDWDVTSIDESSNWGLVVHKALELLNEKNSINSVVEKLICNQILPKKNASKIKTWLKSTIEIKEVKKYFFNPNTFAEKEILLKDGSSFRPDRVLIKENNAYILDFKTGKKHHSHFNQLDNYERVINQMGYDVKEKAILYLNNFEFISNW